MRRFLCCFVLVAAIILQASPAMAWPRWVRPQNKQLLVQFERTRVSAVMWAHVTAALREWSRSGRVDAVGVAKCSNPHAYCIKVVEYRARDGRAGHTELNADPRTNRAWYGKVSLNLYYLTAWSQRRKAACHETGHALGAVHRLGQSCMAPGLLRSFTRPGAADFAYFQRIYLRPG